MIALRLDISNRPEDISSPFPNATCFRSRVISTTGGPDRFRVRFDGSRCRRYEQEKRYEGP